MKNRFKCYKVPYSKKFLKNGFPTKKLESWKFTDVNNILNKKKFRPLIKKEDEKKINIKNNQFYQKNSITIIFNNGFVNIEKNFSILLIFMVVSFGIDG